MVLILPEEKAGFLHSIVEVIGVDVPMSCSLFRADPFGNDQFLGGSERVEADKIEELYQRIDAEIEDPFIRYKLLSSYSLISSFSF